MANSTREVLVSLSLAAGAAEGIEKQIGKIKGTAVVNKLKLDKSAKDKIKKDIQKISATANVKIKIRAADTKSVNAENLAKKIGLVKVRITADGKKSDIAKDLAKKVGVVKVKIAADGKKSEIAKTLSNKIGVVKIGKIDASRAIGNVRKQLQSMLSALSVENGVNITGLGGFLGAEGAEGAASKIIKDANKAVEAMNRANEAAARWKGQLQSLKSVSSVANNSFKSVNKTLAGTKELGVFTSQIMKLNEAESLLRDQKSGEPSDIHKLIGEYQQLITEMLRAIEVRNKETAAQKAATRANLEQVASMKDVARLNNDIQKTLKNNTRLKGSIYESQLNALSRSLDSEGITNEQLKEYRKNYQAVVKEATIAGKMGMSFTTRLNMMYNRLLSWGVVSSVFMYVGNAVRSVFNNVRELDAAMTQLRKVTDESNSTYQKFFDGVDDRAKSIGATMSDTINASADFARLGYDIDTASKMADAALVYKNVGDNIEDISQASESLTSTIQAFKDFGIEATDAMLVVDRFNEVGNNFAISSDGIGEALQRSASALSAANNNLDESIGLITAANTIAQDPKKVGTTLKTISMYLRSSKTELEDAGESTEGMVESVSKLRGELLALTGGKVDIVDMNGAYKSTYDILRELSEVWEELSDLTQANILEKIGGKRNANITSAIIHNFDIAERAMLSSANSAGSALKENEKYLDSVNGRIAVLKASWEDLSQSVLDSSILKTGLSTLTGFLDSITNITTHTSAIGQIAGIIVGIQSISRLFKDVERQPVVWDRMFQTFRLGEKSVEKGAITLAKSLSVLKNEGGAAFSDMVKNAWLYGRGGKKNMVSESYFKDYIKLTRQAGALKRLGDAEGLAEVNRQLNTMNMRTPALKAYVDEMERLGKAPNFSGYVKSLEQFGIKSKIAAAGARALGIAMASLETMGVALVITGITKGLSALHKALFTTKEELEEAKTAAEDYTSTMASLKDYNAQIGKAYEDLSMAATSSDRLEIYQQLASLQEEIIGNYGSEAYGLNLVGSSAQKASEQMHELEKQSSKIFMDENDKEVKSAKRKMESQDTYDLWFGFENAAGASKGLQQFKSDLSDIFKKYGGNAYGEGELGLTLLLDGKDAESTLISLQTEVQELINAYGKKGTDVSGYFSELGNLEGVFSEQLQKARNLNNVYKDLYDAGVQAAIVQDDAYYDASKRISEAQSNLQEAAAGSYATVSEKNDALRKSWEEFQALRPEKLLGDKYGVDKGVTAYFDELYNSIERSFAPNLLELDLDKMVNLGEPNLLMSNIQNQLNGVFAGLNLEDLKMAMFEVENGRLPAYAQGFEIMNRAAKIYGVTLEQLLDKMAEYNVIVDDTNAKAYQAQERLNEVSAISTSGTFGSALTAKMEDITKNNGLIDLDTYNTLIAASSDYAKAIDYENGYMRLNIEKAYEMANAKAEVASSSIIETKKEDLEKYQSNLAKINQLIGDGGSLYSTLSDADKARVSTLQAENEQISKNIGLYNVYLSQIKQAGSAYSMWKQTSESSNSNVVANDMQEALDAVKEAQKNKQTGVGNVQYQMAVKMLVPESEIENAGEYINNTLSKYFTKNNPKTGLDRFMEDMAEAGQVDKLPDGGYKMLNTANLDEAATKLNMTKEVVEGLLDSYNMYSDVELKFVDPQDISNGIDLLNQYQQKLIEWREKQASSDKEGAYEAREQVDELAKELAGLPEEMRIALGIDITTTENGEVTSVKFENETQALMTNSDKMQAAVDNYKKTLAEFNELGVDPNKTVFGNIDLDRRAVIEWADANISKYYDVLAEYAKESKYGEILREKGADAARQFLEGGAKLPKSEVDRYIQDNFANSISTVFGGSETYKIADEEVEIAFSPMLQIDEDHAELLSPGVVDEYINKLIKEAVDPNSENGEKWSVQELLSLDADGTEVEGKKIKGLIADIGETARTTGEAMHYLGKDGALALAQRQIEELGGDVKWDEQTSKLTENVLKGKDYEINLKTSIDEGNQEGIDYYNKKLEETNKITNELAAKKFGIENIDITNLDGLLGVLQKIDKENTGDRKLIEYYISLQNDAEVHEKLTTIRNEIKDKEEQKLKLDPEVDRKQVEQLENEIAALNEQKILLEAEFNTEEVDKAYTRAEQILKRMHEIANDPDTKNEFELEAKLKEEGLLEEIELINKTLEANNYDPIEIPYDFHPEEGSESFEDFVGTVTEAGVTVPVKFDSHQVLESLQGSLEGTEVTITPKPKDDGEGFLSKLREFFAGDNAFAGDEVFELDTKQLVADASIIMDVISLIQSKFSELDFGDSFSGSLSDGIGQMKEMADQIMKLSDLFNGDQPVTIDVEANAESLSSSLSGLIEATPPFPVKAKIDALNFAVAVGNLAMATPPIPLKINVDQTSVLAAMASVTFALGMAPPVTVKSKVDTSTIVSDVSAAVTAASGQTITLRATVDTSGVSGQIAAVKNAGGTVNISGQANVNTSGAMSQLQQLQNFKISNKHFTITSNAASVLSQVRALNAQRIANKSFTIKQTTIKQTIGGDSGARGTPSARGGKTLVGELGPEIVASGGKYYMVGQTGAEFVTLKRGDIVFNHKDTAQLLSGKKGIRGQALAEGGQALGGGTNSIRHLVATSGNKVYSNRQGTALTSSASKATESLDKKIEDLSKDFSKIIENFDSAVEVALKQHADIGDIIKTYKDAQNAISEQADKYRKKGIAENSKYINDLKKQWYDYAEKIADAIKETYEQILEEYENIAEKSEKRVAKALNANQTIDAHKYLQNWIDALTEQQQIIHEEADTLRAQGFSENSDEISELSMKWWDLEEDKLDAIIDMYDKINDQLKETIDLYEHMFEVSTGEGDRHNMQIAQSYILGSLKAQQDVIEKQIIAYRDLGYSDYSEEIIKLKNEWYKTADAVDDARDKMIDSLGDIVKAASDAVDKIQDVYKTLHDAADEYKENGGYISVDTFQELIELGPQYMQYLQDENGLLVINEENVKRVIAAKTEQMAVESALSYVEQVKTAFLSEDAQRLNNLLFATEQATDGTWGFVYANAALLKTMGLSEEQYSAMMWNIDALRSVAENAVTGIDQIEKKSLDAKKKSLDSLEDMQDNLDDLIDYVMDMLEDRLDDQIDKLKDLQDEYDEIIDLKEKSLRITKEENDYQKGIADKIREASKLQSQIQALSFDDSREAKAQRRKLEEQLADIQSEIADKQADYALDRQEDMLDDMADAYKKQKNDEIEELEKTYSSKEKLYQAASEYLSENWETIYQELLDWNYEQGSVLNREITEAWRNAQKVANEYGTDVKSITEQITADIQKIKEEINSIDTEELNLIVSQLSGQDRSYSDDDFVRAIIDMMEENSADWINGNQSTTHVSNVALSNMLKSYGINTEYEDKTGEWYLAGTKQRLYDLKGSGYSIASNKATSEVDEKTALEDIRGVANSMRANSAAWFKSDKKEDLAQENVDMAAGLKSKYGFVIEKTKDGEWIIKKDPYNSKNVGRRFYDTYHKGGIVGRMGTVKQNEMIAKLEKGEAVLDKKKESGVIRLLDFASSIADKVDDVMSNSAFSGIMSNQLLFDTGAFGSVTQPQIYNVNFGDTYITGTSEENIKAHQKITRDFANDVLKQLNIRK